MFLYNTVVSAYGLLIRLAALRKAKASHWINGRKNWRHELRARISASGAKRFIWVHCASYGEFEQGRPLVERLSARYPDHSILLSFFSPSGYEAFSNWPGAAVVCYLPLDSRKNARDFIALINPEIVIFIKYEFWLHYLLELDKKKIPTYLVSAVFKKHHPFFKWYGGIFRKSLATFTKLFIQDETSGALLRSIGVNNFEICGDTRFDRVLQIKNNFIDIRSLQDFKQNSQLLVAGSTWPGDEELVLDAFKAMNEPDFKLLLVPHDIDEKRIHQLVHQLKARDIAHSLFTDGIRTESRVLVLNTMGMLSRAYHYADAAYIGGGLNGGLHNLLEAAVYGIPVFFYGKGYEKFNEAVELLDMRAGFKILHGDELARQLNALLKDKAELERIRKNLDTYFQKNARSSDRILELIAPRNP